MNKNGISKSLKQPLWFTWTPDLRYLVEKNYVCAFTCADEANDLAGETVMHSLVLSSRYVLSPMANPFHFATHMVSETGDGNYCGNQFLYMVQGQDEQRKSKLMWDPTGEKEISSLADLKSLYTYATDNFTHGNDVGHHLLPGVIDAVEIVFPEAPIVAAPLPSPKGPAPSPKSEEKGESKSNKNKKGKKKADQSESVVSESTTAVVEEKCAEVVAQKTEKNVEQVKKAEKVEEVKKTEKKVEEPLAGADKKEEDVADGGGKKKKKKKKESAVAEDKKVEPPTASPPVSEAKDKKDEAVAESAAEGPKKKKKKKAAGAEESQANVGKQKGIFVTNAHNILNVSRRL